VLKLTVGVVKAQVETSRAQEAKAKADLAAAKATADRAAADFKRATELVSKNAVSAQDADAMRAASIEAAEKLKAAQDGVVAAEASVKMSLAMVDAFKAYAGGSEVKTQQAELDVEQAKLDLSYTQISAPMDGRVTRKGVEAGAFVQPGQNLMAIVTPNVWVIGNFKETQLRDMRAGQPAEVRIDAHPDRTYRAHVDSIQAGSGARFSLFPPENATGNFVKVVQRVPVKIVFDEPLDPAIVAGPGLSVDPEVVVGKELLVPMMQTAIATGIALLIFVLIVSRGKKAPASAN
jgi:membrane fusion protein, multidrug efflux system